ncbi:FAD-dependent oxidoreductase [Muricoccus aerilatus]|uniref:FAD-dependent oxidoreductase n=1 Tax=Muricoccus aerilatus TaxID=452982 RepID=UPI000A06D128|nr:FAD-dependent oxidoreductase [Roseomonas aerilata]
MTGELIRNPSPVGEVFPPVVAEAADGAPGYRRSPDQDRVAPARHPVVVAVVVVGAGPVGLTAAIDLAQSLEGTGQDVLLLDDDDRLSEGSRAICFAKRTLEVFDRLGCGEAMVEKGVTWNRGRVFHQEEPVYSFDLLPEGGHRRPAFINLQQYYVEGFLLERARALPGLEIRWRNRVTAVAQDDEAVTLTVETPEGSYALRAGYVVAADGARSPIRRAMGLESRGRSFRDRFLIADVRMTADFPAERWFWFDPPFHPNQSVLLHSQPDGVWRIDFQLGWDANPEEERRPERVIPRVQALLGQDTTFELEWVSVYTFSCLRMERFRHGRVLFAGDSAHGVSPFGARGANSGVQDADNLAWKLALVLRGEAPDSLLDSYDSERVAAADENILNSTRSTDFITPKNESSHTFRDAVLDLARDCAFARRMVNSGRLSLPTTYDASPLGTPDADSFAGAMVPGAPALDAPLAGGWLLERLGGGFTLLHPGGETPALPETVPPLHLVALTPEEDAEGLAAVRYDARPGTTYLIRPDQHVCARWRRFDAGAIRTALRRATGAPGC